MQDPNSFPDEILENIFYLLSPYRDIPNVKQVCRRWQYLAVSVERSRQKKFEAGIVNRRTVWTRYVRPDSKCCVTPRFSHSACYHNKNLYIFGGCTSSSTTFNDLWRFDLTKNTWIRPIILGSYPSPKAWATLVSYHNELILYGGWSPSLPNTLQSPKFFNELHIYSVLDNSWKLITTFQPPSGRAGHMSTIFNHAMIVFGGCCAFEQCTDEIWSLDLVSYKWVIKETSINKPLKRYSHGQALINDNYLIIVGGYGGANRQYNDIWLLNMSTAIWQWTEISVVNPQFCTPQLWSHPICKVGNFLILLGKSNPNTAAVRKCNQKQNGIKRVAAPPQFKMDVDLNSNEAVISGDDTACRSKVGQPDTDTNKFALSRVIAIDSTYDADSKTSLFADISTKDSICLKTINSPHVDEEPDMVSELKISPVNLHLFSSYLDNIADIMPRHYNTQNQTENLVNGDEGFVNAANGEIFLNRENADIALNLEIGDLDPIKVGSPERDCGEIASLLNDNVMRSDARSSLESVTGNNNDKSFTKFSTGLSVNVNQRPKSMNNRQHRLNMLEKRKKYRLRL